MNGVMVVFLNDEQSSTDIGIADIFADSSL